MLRKPKILAFSGSSRKGSFNVQLLNIATEESLAAGAEVTCIDLRNFSLPIYDADLEAEQGIPDNVRVLRELMMANDGFLIASPEYNGSISALLKNTLDWCSRPAGGFDGLAPYRGKTVMLMSASLSPFGGVRGLISLRGIMAKLGSVVLADDLALATAQNAFDENCQLFSEPTAQALRDSVTKFIKFTYALHVKPTTEMAAR